MLNPTTHLRQFDANYGKIQYVSSPLVKAVNVVVIALSFNNINLKIEHLTLSEKQISLKLE